MFGIVGGNSDSGYQISRSLRFNDDDSAYLSRTFGTATDRKKFTLSLWYKRANLAGSLTSWGGAIFAVDGINIFGIGTDAASPSDKINLWLSNGGSNARLISNAVYRDPTAWMNLQLAVDTTQANAADRARVYYNGSEVTSWGTDSRANIVLNGDCTFNSAVIHQIGRYAASLGHIDGYLSEVSFIDGQALSPSSFGELDATTGAWNPKKYGGTYGANGFYLDFSDNSNTTSSTLGKDRSGNNNDWTPTNFSVTAGTGNDSLTDSPTSYASNPPRGNFCVLSPINKHSGSAFLLSNGNLQARGSTAANHYHAIGTMQIPAGKFYFEMTADADTWSAAGTGVGVCDSTFANRGYITGDTANTSAGVWLYLQDGNKRNNGSSTAFGSTYTTNDIIGVAVDATDPTSVKIWFSKNGTWQASGNPDTGANPAYTITTGPVWAILKTVSCATGQFFNFGQRPFNSTTDATTFKEICTQNFTTPAVKNPKTLAEVSDRTGTGSAGSKTGLLFQPNIIMNKPRNAAGLQNNPWTTSNRGTGKFKPMYASAEQTDANAITAFNSDGFSFGTSSSLNTNSTSYFDLSLKDDPTNGIQLISWTGDGNATQAISHSLGKKPSLVLAAGMGATYPYLWHKNFTGDAYFQRDNSGFMSPESNTNSPFSAFGTTTITVTNNATNNLNANGTAYIALLFADGPMFQSGAMLGNASTDGPVLYSGFKPAIFGVYNETAQHWYTINQPGDYNGNTAQRTNPMWSSWGAQAATGTYLDLLSNGAKLRSSSSTYNSATTSKYWFAIAEIQDKYARAV